MMRAGKVLVFANLCVAVAIVTWAVSLTANRTEWFDTGEGAQRVTGELNRLRKEIQDLNRAAKEASGVYGQREQALADAESGSDPGREGRDYRKAVFLKRLEEARAGNFTEHLQLPGKVLIDVSRVGEPIRGPNNEPRLLGVDVYNDRLDRAVQQSRMFTRQIDADRAKFAELSDQIKDTNERIDVQREIVANLADELRYLASVQINWDAELRTLQTRQRQLERRIRAFEPEGN